MLNRAEEASKSQKEEFIELASVGATDGDFDPSILQDLSDSVVCEEVEWTRKDPPYDASILDSREGKMQKIV